MRRVLALCTLTMNLSLLTVSPSFGDNDVMTFRGLRFGVDVREQIPECKKDCALIDPVSGYCPDLYLHNFKQTCWQSELKGSSEPNKVQFSDSLTDSLVIWDGLVNQSDGKLSSISFFFQTAAFPQLETLFRAKYGQPKLVREEPWQSKGGVRTKSQLRIWDLKDLHIEIAAPFDKVDQGWATILTQEQRRKRQKNDAERLEQLRKDL